MKMNFLFTSFIIILFYSSISLAQTNIKKSDLQQSFNLAVKHSNANQIWKMETKVIYYSLNGERIGEDVYRLYLKCNPSNTDSLRGDKYTCIKFTIQYDKSPEVELPSLANWSYLFDDSPNGQGLEMFGIKHSKFENLVDANGKPLPPDKNYLVYNSFIDFHAMCNVFSKRTYNGSGIQDLRTIGQKIVHASAYGKVPVDLGSNIEKGSYFKNGKITLELKGLSLVNNQVCALLRYDSGESSFKMLMKPMPNMEVSTVGSSHYRGDIYKDLNTGWVQRATLNELVVSETDLSFQQQKITSVIEREIEIDNVTGEN